MTSLGVSPPWALGICLDLKFIETGVFIVVANRDVITLGRKLTQLVTSLRYQKAIGGKR